MDYEITKSKLIRLYPTKKQESIFKNWIDVSRYFFNRTLGYLIENKTESLKVNMLRKVFINDLEPEWSIKVPYQVKSNAMERAYESFFASIKSAKENHIPAKFNFKKRKTIRQSCYIFGMYIGRNGICPSITGENSLIFGENLPSTLKEPNKNRIEINKNKSNKIFTEYFSNTFKTSNDDRKEGKKKIIFPENVQDSTLIWNGLHYYLSIPYTTKSKITTCENQARIVALDPGIRNFITFFSENSCGFLGKNDFSRIQRLCFHLDKLISKTTKISSKDKKLIYKKAAIRIQEKIKNLVKDLHQKVSKFLVENFDMILLPKFKTKEMSLKNSKRKLSSKSVRNLLNFSFYSFKQLLVHKAKDYGKKVFDVCEAYTSKTHPQTGIINNKLGSSKRIKLLDGSFADRDIIGARNILLRALVDLPHNFYINENYCAFLTH